MRTNLNDITSQRLIEIMHHLGFHSTNHTLNVIISDMHKLLIQNKNPTNEVVNGKDYKEDRAHL